MTITYDVNFGQTKLGRLENCLRKVLQVELHNLVLLCLCTFLACWFHRLFFVRIWKIQSMAFTLNLKFLMLTGCLLQAKDFTLLENLMYLCQLFVYNYSNETAALESFQHLTLKRPRICHLVLNLFSFHFLWHLAPSY